MHCFFESKVRERGNFGGRDGGGGSGEREDMDGSEDKERWCVLRCARGVQYNTNEIINHTMLRFRPIAPKPVTNGTVSGNLLIDNGNSLLTSKRSKRKYVRVRKNNGFKRKKNNKETEDGLNKNVVTLQLLPEKPSTARDLEALSWCSKINNNDDDLDLMMGSKFDDNRHDLITAAAISLNFKEKDIMINGGGVSDQTVEVCRRRVTVVETWVTVESVTDTCMDLTKGLDCTDLERIKINLVNDTCPWFISDGLNRVLWVNEEYKKMVVKGDGSRTAPPEIEIMVWLVIKEKLPSLEYGSAFTTKVRLQYTWQMEKYSKMVPCDVFRTTDGGVFAWRLDVEAALCLGR